MKTVHFGRATCRSPIVRANLQLPAATRPVLLLSANSAWNVANFRLGLIRALVDSGYEIAVAAPADGHEALLSRAGLTFVPLAIDRSGMNPLTDLLLLGRYVSLMRRLRPAAYLGFTIKPNIYGSIAARLTGVPALNNISGLGTMFLGSASRSRLALALYRLALRKSAAVFFQNPDDCRQFTETGTVRPGQARLLPGSGIELDRYAPSPVPTGPPTFLFIGRLLADKGVREFVEAARLVHQTIPDARFELLGGLDAGNRTGIGSEELKRWTISGQVEHLGEASDVMPHIARATAVVLPSYREGLPRVLLEAAAMGRPLIATDVPGCRSVVEHGKNGLLCDVRNAESLAEAMVRLAGMTAEERAAMGGAARQTVERDFSERKVIDAYLAVLAETAAGFGVGKR